MRISLRSLTKSFGSERVLDEISLVIEPGQIVALLGANGAGKTSLLRCLAGIAGPERGDIYYDSEQFRRDRVDLRKRFFLQPDFPFVHADMKLLRHIGLVLRLYDANLAGVERKVIDLLEQFDMLPYIDAELGTLSRGQAYKAALVALLAVDPEFWMLDEPFASGMDPRGLSAFRRLAADAADRGRTVLYTTQILELAEEFSDRICILHRGKIYAFGTVDQLRERTHQTGDGVLEEIFQQLHEGAT
jgi:ABC-type multidrug transport system ATPase subunit